ncbi:MAG TPA: UvrD-helicase domain-containing protein [Bryobacteraceae bacterium]|nr:UvrD-helicase domain-containing protein [Bryobacteraceae bacterium]
MDFLEGLNPQQREAVAHVEGPLLLLAGAGSGKTRVITHRIAHLMRAHRVPGSCLLAVTFTNKAAEEMRQRIFNLLGEPVPGELGPQVSTFHSFCVRLLRRDGGALSDLRPGFTRNFTIYDDDDQLSVLKSVYRELGLDEKFMAHRAALSIISHAKNHNERPADFYKSAKDPKASRLAVVYERYEDRLQRSNALDFDDLLLEAVRLLRHDADTRLQYNRRFEFLLIDEYQDTNRSQYELMRLLSEAQKNVCVVGDEDQSIYGWRGADIRNILDFEQDFPACVTIRLERNYRSTKNILEAASAVVSHNLERKGKWLWTEAEEGAKIGLYAAHDAENEALFIADTIDRILRANPGERVAVLYRTNFQSRQIEEALRRCGRKYLVIGGVSFYQRAEVKDTLAYLKALKSSRDSVSLLRIINTPARGIGKTTVEQIDSFARERGLSIWDAIGQMLEERVFPARAEAALREFRRMMEDLAGEVKDKSLRELLGAVLRLTGYRAMLEEEQSPEAESKLGNLNELLNAAAEADERGETLADFLDHAALVADADGLDERAQVSLLTMHNAKGMEYPVVFIAGLEEGLFPHSRSRESAPMLEEERRLCYVGMTRARKRLYLTWAHYRRRFGGGQPEASLPSRFLREVPPELIEDFSERQAAQGHVDLLIERHEVRETVRKNLYTGKTYNSLDNISQFFADRGMPAPRGIQNASQVAKPVAQAPAAPVTRPQGSVAVPPKKPKKLGTGATVRHPKYGIGTLLRREGDGEDAKLTISFQNYGLKKLIEKYAAIEVIG